MAAPVENTFWKLRSKHGRDKIFKTPQDLWKAACKYFAWCDNNPLQEAKVFAYKGEITTTTIPKMRAYTLDGLCLYMGCNEAYFRQFNDNGDKDFSTVIYQIEKTIYNQKFTGAAADLLNANIISRDLGLADRIDFTKLSDEDLDKILEKIIKK
jgi:hypothetical protein